MVAVTYPWVEKSHAAVLMMQRSLSGGQDRVVDQLSG
jgi:hypothetical protein